MLHRSLHRIALLVALSLLAACEDDPVGTTPCTPHATRCAGDLLQTCPADGLDWADPVACEAGSACRMDRCIPTTCADGDGLCVDDVLLTCAAGGWLEETCDPGWECFLGKCRECAIDDDCGDHGKCNDGVCEILPVEILTETLPDGMVGTAYDAALEVNRDGCTWDASDLPGGLALSGDGHLSGTPTAPGGFLLGVTADCGAEGTADASLLLTIHAEGLVIVTDALPNGLEGFDYAVALEALGGMPPYAWMISEGALPAGLVLTSAGSIEGIPSEIGDFPLVVKVFDDSNPPEMASRALSLTVEIAPLEIYGTTEYNLLVEKVIVLDTITVVTGIPIPYTSHLTARGGLRPYAWTEVDLPAALGWIIPTSGIPDGLTLDADGTLHGAVTSTDQVVTVSIPFSGINITGYFFSAQVADSQSPAEVQQAVFVVPTIPIGH